MKTAAVVIDRHKLDTFKRYLTTAGYDFTEHPGVTPETLTLKVKCKWVAKLQPIIEAANKECAK